MTTREYLLDVTAPDGGKPGCAARYALVCLTERVVIALATACCAKAERHALRLHTADCVTTSPEAIWLDAHMRAVVPILRLAAAGRGSPGFVHPEAAQAADPGSFETLLHTDGTTLSFRLSNWFGSPPCRVVTRPTPVLPLVAEWLQAGGGELQTSGLLTRLVRIQAKQLREPQQSPRPKPHPASTDLWSVCSIRNVAAVEQAASATLQGAFR
jgi:hypothetical protein